MRARHTAVVQTDAVLNLETSHHRTGYEDRKRSGLDGGLLAERMRINLIFIVKQV